MMKQFIINKGEEIWESVPNYEGYYEVSSFGNVRSVDRIIVRSDGATLNYKGRLLKQSVDSAGYMTVGFSKNYNQTHMLVHFLVWDAFGNDPRDGHKMEVDHINNTKTDNNINNLQLLPCRANVAKYHKTRNMTSQYPGVHWDAKREKWLSQIYNNKHVFLGRFNCETAAMITYQQALAKIERGEIIRPINKRVLISDYLGVSWSKEKKKWKSQASIDNTTRHIGYFDDEYEAHLAYKKARNIITT